MVRIVPQTAVRMHFANPLEAAEYAARICYRSDTHDRGPEARKKFLMGLANRKHGTPFEHAWLCLNKQDITEDEWNEIDMMVLEEPDNKGPHVFPVDQFTYDDGTKTLSCNMRSLINLCGIDRAFQLMDKAWTRSTGVHTFEIITSRAIGNQLIRHRALSFVQAWQLPEPSINQESLRWVRMDDPVVCLSEGYQKELNQDPGAMHIWRASCQRSFEAYSELVSKGYKKELARTVLPLATATRILMTAPINVWYEFLKLRLEKGAEPMMQELAESIYKDLKTEFRIKHFDVSCSPFTDHDETSTDQ